MRKQNDIETEQTVMVFYDNMSDLVKERGIKMKDLSMMMGIGPRTLSSMKSQNQNPGLMSMKKIADTLDVTLDELIDDSRKDSMDLHNLVWFLRKIRNTKNASIIYKQLLSIGETLAQVPECCSFNREDASRRETQQRVKTKLYDQDELERVFGNCFVADDDNGEYSVEKK